MTDQPLTAEVDDALTRETKGGFIGHPIGLAPLFFTELWERFSYYGMRSILILYMTSAATHGGLGFDVKGHRQFMAGTRWLFTSPLFRAAGSQII